LCPGTSELNKRLEAVVGGQLHKQWGSVDKTTLEPIQMCTAEFIDF